ncbi:MAG: ComF family protein [Rhodospirillales bacterium]
MDRLLTGVSILRGVGRRALDALLPPRCLACGAIVDEPGALCAPCWAKLAFISPPVCARCGLAFELPPQRESPANPVECAACAAGPPAFDRARAALAYDDQVKSLVLRFKHADATHAAPGLARWMARAGAELLAQCDLIAPVPLHRWRLLWRRYNQAALLALGLGRLARKPAVPDLLVRRRATPSQGRLGPAQRRANVAGAFAIRRGRADAIAGKRVLLVDDVLTTGATAEECAKVLKRAGAQAVDVLTLARVNRPRSA